MKTDQLGKRFWPLGPGMLIPVRDTPYKMMKKTPMTHAVIRKAMQEARHVDLKRAGPKRARNAAQAVNV